MSSMAIIQNYLTEVVETCKTASVLAADLSAAHDLVHHQVLAGKLAYYGCDTNAVSLT